MPDEHDSHAFGDLLRSACVANLGGLSIRCTLEASASVLLYIGVEHPEWAKAYTATLDRRVLGEAANAMILAVDMAEAAFAASEAMPNG